MFFIQGTKRGTVLDEEEFAGTNDDFLPEAMEMRHWDKWIPDPPDANPGEYMCSFVTTMVVNMLLFVLFRTKWTCSSIRRCF